MTYPRQLLQTGITGWQLVCFFSCSLSMNSICLFHHLLLGWISFGTATCLENSSCVNCCGIRNINILTLLWPRKKNDMLFILLYICMQCSYPIWSCQMNILSMAAWRGDVFSITGISEVQLLPNFDKRKHSVLFVGWCRLFFSLKRLCRLSL